MLFRSGLVEARRDGKWMHYSIRWPEDKGGQRVLSAALSWLAEKEEMRADRERYEDVCCSPELLVQIARSPMPFISAEPNVLEAPTTFVDTESAHNELEEFLL